jgi:hypothetical protein
MANKPEAALTPQPPAGRLAFDQVANVEDGSISGTRDTPLPLRAQSDRSAFDAAVFDHSTFDTAADQVENLPPKNSNAVLSTTEVTVEPVPIAVTATLGGVAIETVSSVSADAVAIPAKRRAVRTALLANREVIVLSVEAARLLLDEKIATLDRANSDEARAELEQYRYVKQELDKFRDATIGLVAGKLPEETAVEASLSFSQGIRNWWNKNHVGICNTTFSASIFISCLGICHLSGTDPNLGAVIAGVLAKGKSITDALKGAADLIWGRNQPHDHQ